MRAFQALRSVELFAADKRGTVTIFAGALIAVLIGIISLVGEYGLGLTRQIDDQRISDAAAYAAGTYISSHSGDVTGATSVAKNVARLNGVTSVDQNVTVTNTTTSTNSYLTVKVTTTKPLFLASVIPSGSNSRTSLTTSGTSRIQYSANSSAIGCIIALSTSNGVTLSGGTALTAPKCTIATNATLTVPCGTTITALAITYGGSTPSQPCNGITATTLTQASTSDPFLTNSGVVAAESHVASVASLTAPSAPATASASNTGGTSVSFSLQNSPTTQQSSGGCTATYASSTSTWTISCPAGSNYNFTSFSVARSLSVAFTTSGSGSTTFNFPNAMTMSGGTWTMGAANYNFLGSLTLSSATASFTGAGDIYVGGALTISSSGSTTIQGPGNLYVGGAFATSGSAAVTLKGAGNVTIVGGLTQGSSNAMSFQGAGTYAIGPNTSCNSSTYSICVTNSGPLSFTATDTFSISNGLYVSGGATLSMGSGSTNSFNIGKAGNNNAVWLGGGAKLTFGDASTFQIVGNVNADPGGGSCMTFGAATYHDINGWFSTAGGVTVGTGTYAINGYLAYGNNGGGSVTCNGTTVGMSGTNVTIIYSAATTPSSGNCSGKGLCFTAGFNYVNLTAPTTGTYANLLFIGPQSGTTAGSLFSGGATAAMSGVFYMPKGALTMSGGATINAARTTSSTPCLQIVADSVSMAGGTTAASSCVSSAPDTAIKLSM